MRSSDASARLALPLPLPLPLVSSVCVSPAAERATAFGADGMPTLGGTGGAGAAVLDAKEDIAPAGRDDAPAPADRGGPLPLRWLGVANGSNSDTSSAGNALLLVLLIALALSVPSPVPEPPEALTSLLVPSADPYSTLETADAPSLCPPSLAVPPAAPPPATALSRSLPFEPRPASKTGGGAGLAVISSESGPGIRFGPGAPGTSRSTAPAPAPALDDDLDPCPSADAASGEASARDPSCCRCRCSCATASASSTFGRAGAGVARTTEVKSAASSAGSEE